MLSFNIIILCVLSLVLSHIFSLTDCLRTQTYRSRIHCCCCFSCKRDRINVNFTIIRSFTCKTTIMNTFQILTKDYRAMFWYKKHYAFMLECLDTLMILNVHLHFDKFFRSIYVIHVWFIIKTKWTKWESKLRYCITLIVRYKVGGAFESARCYSNNQSQLLGSLFLHKNGEWKKRNDGELQN